MKIAANTFYIATQNKLNSKSMAIANAMATELACYNVDVDPNLIIAIASVSKEDAKTFCKSILAEYTVGKLTPPLFKDWEARTFFSFEEIMIQICGYILAISGNDLENPNYMRDILSKVHHSKERVITLASEEEAIAKFYELVDVRVSLDKKNQDVLKYAGKTFHGLTNLNKRIYSDEARIAVLLGMSEEKSLLDSLNTLKCKPADVLRYAAALHSFDGVKLPSDVLYGKLKWSTRIKLLSFLEQFGYDELCEAMGINRNAWTRFFNHIHLFNQKDFINRFPTLGLSARISEGYNELSIPNKYNHTLRLLNEDNVIEILSTGNTVYRTFASRVDIAIKEKNFTKLQKLFANNGGYLLRNIGHIANGVSPKDESKFVSLVREKLETASVDVLFSILGINVNAKYRVIDIKGNTVVEPANYPKVIGDIQGDIEREIYRRWGYEGQVIVSDNLEDNIVPFLSKNSNLMRGTRIAFDSKSYLYFFMKWTQSKNVRTDLDHSYIAFDSNWNINTVYFGNQANSYITHGGDITNAPAPKGATEYGKIRLDIIPKNIKYIAPIINVFTGDKFDDLSEAYAGFMFSDNSTFKVESDFTRYDLTQPANSNIPFLIDVENREIVILDFNNRERNGCTAHSEIGNIKNLISAVNDKNYISIGKLAKVLSGKSKKVSLEIRNEAKKDNEITPDTLTNLIK
jgi:stress response protein SCP2